MDKWLENTTVVRITALLLGVLLWAVVHLDEQKSPNTVRTNLQTQTITNVKITTSGLDPKQYYIKSVKPAEVNLKLRGKSSALDRVKTDQYQILLDLSHTKDGEYLMPLQGSGFPSGVELVEIQPSYVTVQVEAMQKKEVPVDIQLKGLPGKGYNAGTPIANPNRVHVLIPESQADEISFVSGTLDITGEQEGIKGRKVKLAAYDTKWKKVDAIITPAIVEVAVPISAPHKTVPLQAKLTGKMPKGYSIASIKSSVEQVTVFGSKTLLDELELYDAPVINLDGLKLTESTEISLDIPLLPEVEKTEPSKVKFEITVEPSITKKIDQIPVLIAGSNDELETRVLQPDSGFIDAEIEGARNLLNNLKSSDIQAIVDVSNLPPGIHEVPVTLNLPNLLKHSGDYDKTVSVEIKVRGAKTQSQEKTPLNPTSGEVHPNDSNTDDSPGILSNKQDANRSNTMP